MVRLRAVKWCSSKKFFVARWPGSARPSIPMQLPCGAEPDEIVDDRLADADLACRLLDEEVGHHAQAIAGPQPFDEGGAEAEHVVVDRADDDQRVVARDQRAVRSRRAARATLRAANQIAPPFIADSSARMRCASSTMRAMSSLAGRPAGFHVR